MLCDDVSKERSLLPGSWLVLIPRTPGPQPLIIRRLAEAKSDLSPVLPLLRSLLPGNM